MHDGVVPRRPSSRAGCYGLVLLAARPGAVGGGPAHTDTAPPTTRLALGVISAPGREALRADARSTWAHASVVPRDVSVRFVLPARELADEALLREAEAHADVLFTNCTDAAPTAAWRKQWLWLEHAARAYGAARWVGKLEDDVFADLAGTRGFLGLPFLNASRPTIVGAWEHFSWLERAGCPVGHGFSLSVAAQAHRQHCAARALRRANESCFGPFVFPKASGVFLSAPALRALLASRARRLAHARSPPACPASAARARPVGARFRGVLSEDVWLGYALRKHVAQRSLVLFSLQLSLLGDNAASKGATSAVSLLLHDQRKTALKLPKKAPRAPPAGGPVLEGAQQEDGGGFSRVRRAHVLRMREPFNASAYRYEVQVCTHARAHAPARMACAGLGARGPSRARPSARALAVLGGGWWAHSAARGPPRPQPPPPTPLALPTPRCSGCSVLTARRG